MEEPTNRYIVLHDRLGNIPIKEKPTSRFSLKDLTPTQAVKGELLEALPEAEQPNDSTRMAFAGIDRDNLRVECRVGDIARLTSEDANLLLGIYCLDTRYETYIDENRLDFGRRTLPGSEVFLAQWTRNLHGTVRYKGILSTTDFLHRGTTFGVELHEHPDSYMGSWMSDGTYGNKRYFSCPPNTAGVFVGLDSLRPPILVKLGQRVVTFTEYDPSRGTVRYIEPSAEEGSTIIGVELDKRRGFGTGQRNGKQLFITKKDHAAFVPLKTVIPEKEFDKDLRKSQNLDEHYTFIDEQTDKDKGSPSGARMFPNGMDQQKQKGVREEQTSQKELTEMQQQQETARLHEQLREKEMSMIRMEQQLRGKDKQQQNLQRKLRKMEQQLTNCHGQLRQKDEQLRGKDKQLTEKDGQLREKDEQLTEKDEQLRGKDEQLTEKDGQLTEKDEQLTEKDEQLTEKDEQLTEKDQQLRENEEERSEIYEQLRLKDEQLRDKYVELTEKDQQVKRKDEQLREKYEEQENLQEQLGEMEQQLREKEQHDENLQRQLREMGRQLTNYEEQLREREEEISNLQQQNSTLESQLRDKEGEINELEMSLSTTQQTINEQRHQGTCDWVIARDEIQISGKCLGKGGWGSVYEGMYCGCTIAVKQIHDLIISPHNTRLFEREMNIASRCRHPCLLQFIGATNDEESPLFVTELMETSLRELLQQQELSETEIAVISLDVAKAINYLHEKKPESIIHRDVSSANVLLWRQGDQWRGKVSDYGAANFMQHTMSVAPGAMIYSAPEALTPNQTVKVDVYSFGVLLCEMNIRELPDPKRRDEQVAMVTNRALRGLVRRCLQTDPEMRPSMLEIIDSLRQFNIKG